MDRSAASEPALPRDLLCLALLTALTVAALYPVCNNRFLKWDDREQFTEHPDFNPPKLSTFIDYFHRRWVGSLYPVSYAFYGILAAIGRTTTPDETGATLSAALFHTAGLGLHLACVWLVYALLRSIDFQQMPAAIGAAWFAVHPLQVEAVAWVSGINTCLCAALALGAAWMYVAAVRRKLGGAKWTALYVGATALSVLALLSKPTAVILPLILFAIDLGYLGRRFKSAAQLLILWILLAVPLMVLTRGLQSADLVIPTPLWTRPLVAADSLSFFLAKLAAPITLMVDYARTPAWVIATGRIDWTWLLPAVAIAAAAWAWRRWKTPWPAVGLAVFTAGLLPTLGLVPFKGQTVSTVMDRAAYLAMLGPAICVAAAVSGRRAPLAYAAVALILLFAVRSHARAQDWHDELTLFGENLQDNPRSLASREVLGGVAAERGDNAEAIAQFQAALQLKPDEPRVHFNLANALMRQGRVTDAIEHYQAAVQREPDEVNYRYNLSVALQSAGRREEAMEQLRELLQHHPDVSAARSRLKRLELTTRPAGGE